jgi:monoamine oxidase
MTIVIDEERRAAIHACRDEIKELNLKNVRAKQLLRTNHNTLKERTEKAAWQWMMEQHYLARDITRLLIEYHQLRGTEDGGRSHFYKE